MKKFLVRLANEAKWDEVNEYVFNLRKFVLDENGKRRYGDQTVTIEGSALAICGAIQADELAKVLRFAGTATPTGSYAPIISEPETVHIVKGNKTTLHVLKTGENWTKRNTKPATPKAVECKAAA